MSAKRKSLTRTAFKVILVIFVVALVIAGTLIATFAVTKRTDIKQSKLPAYGEESISAKPQNSLTQKEQVNVLSIDGGALLGLAELEVLIALEKITGRQTYELFDVVAGSSTGAIISSLLFLPTEKTGKPMTAEQAREEFVRLSSSVFEHSRIRKLITLNGLIAPRFSSAGRIEASKDLFKDATFSELLRPTIFPALLQNNDDPHLFRNWKDSDQSLMVASLVPAVTSAEGLFPAIELIGYGETSSLVNDPVLVLNSPGHVAYLEARDLYPEAKKFVIVTVTTHFRNVVGADLQRHGGELSWIRPAIAISRQSQKYISQMALDAHARFESEVKIENFLLSPDIDGVGSDAFISTPETVQMIDEAGLKFIENHQKLLDQVAKALIASNAP
ncbi:MAG: patatin-like phospholipase family protein [Verrucomicrobiota bacterium]